MQNESVITLIIEVAHQVQGIFCAMYDDVGSLYLGDFLVFDLVYCKVHYALVFLEKEWDVEAPRASRFHLFGGWSGEAIEFHLEHTTFVGLKHAKTIIPVIDRLAAARQRALDFE